MKLNLKYASIDKIPDMEGSYYNFYCALNGDTLTSWMARKIFSKGKTPGKLFKVIDPNYQDALDTIDEAFYANEHVSMIEIQDEEDITIGYARIHWAIGDDERNASVVDVALSVCMSYECALEFYALLIPAAEEFIVERNEKTNLVTHEIPVNNDAYLQAMYDNKDYDAEPLPQRGAKTILYDKWVRNKPRVRLRTTPKK